jgi:hypothetical protein
MIMRDDRKRNRNFAIVITNHNRNCLEGLRKITTAPAQGNWYPSKCEASMV